MSHTALGFHVPMHCNRAQGFSALDLCRDFEAISIPSAECLQLNRLVFLDLALQLAAASHRRWIWLMSHWMRKSTLKLCRSFRRARPVRSHPARRLDLSRSSRPSGVARHDLVAGPCLVLPGPSNGSPSAVAPDWRAARTLRDWSRGSGPARPSVLPHRWVRSLANLNEFFVHHEDVRRANGRGPRRHAPAMDAAFWRNVRRGGRFLGSSAWRLRARGEWAGTDVRAAVRPVLTDGAAQRPAG